MTDLFPIIQPEAVQGGTELPLYREVKWDFEKGEPVFRGGEPVVVEGAEAIKTWVWKALVTERAQSFMGRILFLLIRRPLIYVMWSNW